MNNKRIDMVFILLIVFCFAFFIAGFYSFNSAKKHKLPDSAGKLTEWGVDYCEYGDGYIYLTGWAAPKGVYKFMAETYIITGEGGEYYKAKTWSYRRGNETEEMKSKHAIDNSGFSSSMKIPFHHEKIGPKVAVFALGPDGRWYRGDYDCSK